MVRVNPKTGDTTQYLMPVYYDARKVRWTRPAPAASYSSPVRMRLARPLMASLLLLVTSAVHAQSPPSALPPGPSAPVAPATVARDAEGRATVRAVRVATPIKVDGRLDEAVYEQVQAISGFIQTEPTAGAPSTEKTDAWVLFDDKAIYISFRCWETRVGHRVANEMRRDSTTIIDNDMVAFILDTFRDQTSAAFFGVNSLGGRMDGQFSGTQYNGDWNPLWDARAGAFEGGWTAEIVMPFSSLRYPQGREQEWGINLQRTIRTKNELSFLTRLGNARGPPAIGQMNQAGRMVGLQVPEAAQNIDVKPYASSSLTTDPVQQQRHQRRPRREVRRDAEPGRRPDHQHGLRAGGGGRAAGQPDPLQSPVSGETRILPRESRSLYVRRRDRDPGLAVGRQWRRSDPLL